MQTLYAALPQAVETDGVRYAVNTDWRVALRMFAVLEDETLSELEQQAVLLRLFYKDTVPPDTGEALRLLVKFLHCGAQPETGGACEAPLYSLSHDAPLIYAALRRTYGGDVLDGPMHWYRFAALFADLSADTFFARVLYLRRGRRRGTLTPDERRMAAALGRYMEIPAARGAGDGTAAQAQEFFRAWHGEEAP